LGSNLGEEKKTNITVNYKYLSLKKTLESNWN